MSTNIEKALLRKLHKMGCWGQHHICESNLPKGFPRHFYKEVMKVADELRRKGLLVRRPSHHENQWYLNWDRKNEIEEIIKN